MDRRGHGEITLAICRVYVYDGAWSYVHQMNLTFVDAINRRHRSDTKAAVTCGVLKQKTGM